MIIFRWKWISQKAYIMWCGWVKGKWEENHKLHAKQKWHYVPGQHLQEVFVIIIIHSFTFRDIFQDCLLAWPTTASGKPICVIDGNPGTQRAAPVLGLKEDTGLTRGICTAIVFLRSPFLSCKGCQGGALRDSAGHQEGSVPPMTIFGMMVLVTLL